MQAVALRPISSVSQLGPQAAARPITSAATAKASTDTVTLSRTLKDVGIGAAAGGAMHFAVALATFPRLGPAPAANLIGGILVGGLTGFVASRFHSERTAVLAAVATGALAGTAAAFIPPPLPSAAVGATLGTAYGTVIGLLVKNVH